MSDQKPRDVVVIGAGIIGVCSATYLQRLGRQVTVIDRLPPGEGCSFGNAGSLSPGSCVPTPAPGMLKSVPRWLFTDDGPLSIRWRYLPKILPWLVGFLKAGDPAHVAHASKALRALHAPTLDSYMALAREAGTPDLVNETGYMFVYGSEASHASSKYAWDLRRERGVSFEELSSGQIRELEPDISPRYVKGMLVHGQGYTTNPSRLVKSIAALAAKSGAEILQDEVRGLEIRDGRAVAVITESGSLPVKDVVIAAGAYSRALTDQLGLGLPLDTERGYHITVENAGIKPRNIVMEADYKFLATPMEMGVRFAGMVELAGVDPPMNPRRAQVIVRLAKRMYPGLDASKRTEWMGRRPSMPDGLPVIGRSPRHPNVYLAFGHGHTGMCGGPMTGRIVAGLVTGNTPNIDLAPYRPERFGGASAARA